MPRKKRAIKYGMNHWRPLLAKTTDGYRRTLPRPTAPPYKVSVAGYLTFLCELSRARCGRRLRRPRRTGDAYHRCEDEGGAVWPQISAIFLRVGDGIEYA